MSSPAVVANPSMPIREAALLMRAHGVGALAVLAGDDLVGVVTDRDIVTRAMPDGAVDRPVGEVMSPDPVTCRADQPVVVASEVMGEMQIRRLPVVNGDRRIVGMISLGDIAENVSEELAGQALGEITEMR
ncbi:CBS domain-containing protein [Rhodovulum sp. ES.010]|uniref:CBS domain-containing protein n=1 Tax=Rhodovulum sp. ES.010 TaxID=1882821 RepID=UPI0020C9668A|nr:CBS domain-containing protein [Rhodovulum sp. ES.010]